MVGAAGNLMASAIKPVEEDTLFNIVIAITQNLNLEGSIVKEAPIIQSRATSTNVKVTA